MTQKNFNQKDFEEMRNVFNDLFSDIFKLFSLKGVSQGENESCRSRTINYPSFIVDIILKSTRDDMQHI